MLTKAAVGVGSLVAGWFVSRWDVSRTTARARQTALPPPEKVEVYDRLRAQQVEMYKYGQQQYDRLVPWGAGGALLISVTLLEKLIQAPALGTMRILAAGWGFLFLALVASLLGHYTSARSYEAGWDALDIAQEGKQTPENRVAYARKDKTTWRMNTATRVLNILAGVGLVVGVLLIIVFAYINIARRTPCQMI